MPKKSRLFTWGRSSAQDKSSKSLTLSTTATWSKAPQSWSSRAVSSGERKKSLSRWRSHSSPPDFRPRTHTAVEVSAAAWRTRSSGRGNSSGLGVYLPKISYIRPLLTASFSQAGSSWEGWEAFR